MTRQTSVSAIPVGTAGQITAANSVKGTKVNSSVQVDTVTVSAADTTTTVTVNGNAYTDTVSGSKTTTAIAAALVALINTGESEVVATSSGAVITLVSTTVGTGYTVAATTSCSTASVNANSGAIGFGLFVCADSNDFDNAKQPTVATDITSRRALGFTPFTNTREADDEGYAINKSINFVGSGKLWVVAEEAMTMADTVYVRFTGAVSGSKYIGAVRTDADSSSAAALDGCSVVQYDATTGLAEISVNLPF